MKKRIKVFTGIILSLCLILIFSQACAKSQKVTKKTPVAEKESWKMIELNSPVSDPSVIKVGHSTPVIFNVRVYPTQTDIPTSITLKQVTSDGKKVRVLGELKDDGSLPSYLAGDFVYSGRFHIQKNDEGKIYFIATYKSGIHEIRSKIYGVPVTRLPIGLQNEDPKFLADTGKGYKVYTNELLVIFVEGTKSNRLKEIISAVGGTIVGSMLQINGLQIHLPGNTSLKFAKSIIKKLESYPEIRSVELHGPRKITFSKPE